jgi:hypothetical protein
MAVEREPTEPASTPANILADALGESQARAALAALSAAGWVCVPRAPTAAMLDEAWASAESENAALVWRDMIEEVERAFM